MTIDKDRRQLDLSSTSFSEPTPLPILPLGAALSRCERALFMGGLLQLKPDDYGANIDIYKILKRWFKSLLL